MSRLLDTTNGSAGDVSTFAFVPSERDSPAAEIEFDAAGDLFVADIEDEVWIVNVGSDGSVVGINPFVSGLNLPFALEFDSSGKLFVGGTSGDIWRIDSDGNVSLFATGFANAGGLAFDALGNLFVAEFNPGRIMKITGVYEPRYYMYLPHAMRNYP